MRDARRRWIRWGAVASGVLAVAFACEEDDEVRPAYITDCNEPACMETRTGVPVVIGAGTNVPGGEAGAGGSGGMPSPGVGTLTGVVQELAVSDLLTRQSLVGGVEVRAPRAGGPSSDPVIDQTDSSGAYLLEGVQAGAVTWVGVGNFASPPVEPYIDTLQAVDATRDERVDLLVARRDALRDAVSVAFLNDPVELDTGLAHLVVRFVRPSGVAIDGVTITFPPVEQVPTAYDAGDAFSSALDATAERGSALLVNLSAPPYPGGTTTIVAELDGQPFSAELQIAAGALTVVAAVVPDP